MTVFNAKASRAKRPCPIWVDAFQRDTQHLEADEIGAYFLILMAMWTRESCDFPDDDNRLARVSRVSPRLWKLRIGPVLRAFLTAADGVVFSKRLRGEASYVERQVKQQSDRKAGEKSCNPLYNNDVGATADITADEPRHHPSQQPNNLQDSPEAKASGRDASSPQIADPSKDFWDRAVAYLKRHGHDERPSRSFIGKSIKLHGMERVRSAFRAAHEADAVDPIPWITAHLGAANREADIKAETKRILEQRLAAAAASDERVAIQ